MELQLVYGARTAVLEEQANTSLYQRIYDDFSEHANARREWSWIAGRIIISNIFLTLILQSGITDAAWLSAVFSVAFMHMYSAASAVQLLRGQTVSAFAMGALGDTASLLGVWLALILGDTSLFVDDETYLVLFPIMITLPYRYGIYAGTNIALVLLTWFSVSQFVLLKESSVAIEEYPTRMLFLTSTLALAATFRHFLDQKAKSLLREAEVLRKLNEAKTSFVGTVSHELRTPLTSMLTFVTRFSRNRENNLTERQLELLKVIERNGWHLTMLIDDLVDMSRIERGELAYNEEDFSFDRLIRETLVTITELGDRDGSRVTVTGAESAMVHGDRNRYRQVLLNLLGNAFKYSPEGTPITVESRVSKDGMQVRICNRGGGLSEDDKTKMFELFHRVDNDVTNSRPGTGIGLYISRVIVKGHGGEVWAESDEDTTTLCLTIPAERIVTEDAGHAGEEPGDIAA